MDVTTAAQAAHTLEGFGASSRIRAALPRMSDAMAKIGTLLIEDPSLPLRLSITELAQAAGTSPATVTRFCRAIGYAGYPTLRVGAAAEQGRASGDETWKADIGREFHPGDSPTDVVRTLVNAHSVALASTADAIDPDLIARVAAAVASSGHVDIYGIGGSAGMAVELQARLYRIGINAHAWSEVHVALTSAALLGETAVAIAFSNTGRTEETIEMLTLAKSSGAFSVAVTSDPTSPLAEVADAHLAAVAPGAYLQPDDLSAKHAQLFVIDLLYLLVAQQDFSRTTSLLAASAAAVSPHRRRQRGAARAGRAPIKTPTTPSKGTR
ncbi:MurR/RpiR family transcriptional regulator [Nocardioides sp. KR10-350]